MVGKGKTIAQENREIDSFFEQDISNNQPNPKGSNRLDMETVVASLLSFTPGEPSKEVLDKCSQLLAQQRVIEDTRARRRLEKWATNVIVWYLIVVGVFLLLNGIGLYALNERFITDEVMIAILTTTTVNIIGLGIIVLKGHFSIRNRNKQELQ